MILNSSLYSAILFFASGTVLLSATSHSRAANSKVHVSIVSELIIFKFSSLSLSYVFLTIKVMREV